MCFTIHFLLTISAGMIISVFIPGERYRPVLSHSVPSETHTEQQTILRVAYTTGSCKYCLVLHILLRQINRCTNYRSACFSQKNKVWPAVLALIFILWLWTKGIAGMSLMRWGRRPSGSGETLYNSVPILRRRRSLGVFTGFCSLTLKKSEYEL